MVELAGAFPLVNAVARDSARTAWNRLPTNTKPLIDGLALPAFEGFEDVLDAHATVGLIHHPVSMETGLSHADEAMLAAIEHRLFRSLRRLIVTSETTAATLSTRFQLSSDNIRVIVPGTDDAPRSPGSNGCELLSIGTLVPRKGHDVLLRAMAALADLAWQMTIVGSPDRDPAHARGLLALAENLNIDHRVRFAGELVGDALDAVWRGADIFALATYYEGYGMVIAEALKRGLPVVVTDGGAAGTLITQGAGCVSPIGDAELLAHALRPLISDGSKRRDMARGAWQAGQSLPSWDEQSALFAAALN